MGSALAATPYLETTLILFLHILAAMLTMAGAVGLLVLYLQARRSVDDAELRSTLRLLSVFGRSVFQPGAGMAGVLGLILVFRYDARGIFAFEKQGWMFLAVVLWLVLQGVAGAVINRSGRTAPAADGSIGDAAAVRARLAAPATATAVWLTLIVTVVIVYLMVFQPLVFQ